MKITKILAIILQTESYNSLGKKKKKSKLSRFVYSLFCSVGKTQINNFE